MKRLPSLAFLMIFALPVCAQPKLGAMVEKELPCLTEATTFAVLRKAPGTPHLVALQCPGPVTVGQVGRG